MAATLPRPHCVKIYVKHDRKQNVTSNLQTHYQLKLDFQKVDQHTGGKWLIHGAKHRKDNQLQSL